MERQSFRGHFLTLATRLSRREFRDVSLSLLAGLGITSIPDTVSNVEAGNRKRRRRRRRKLTICHDGVTIKVARKHKQKHLKHGDTLGPCVTATCIDPTQDLQAVFDAAEPGALIQLCAGRWSVERQLVIRKDLTLRGMGSDQTILEGNRADRIIWIPGALYPSAVAIQNLAVTGGNPRFPERHGGGIYNDALLTLNGCNVYGNTAEDGGGIVNGLGTLTLVDSQVTDNSAFRGAGIFNLYAPVSLLRSMVAQNTARDTGGGIYNGDGPVQDCAECGITLREGSKVSRNKADRGGGIFNSPNSVVRLEAGSSVTENNADTAGGGIFNLDGIVTIADVSIVIGNDPNNCAGDNIPSACVG